MGKYANGFATRLKIVWSRKGIVGSNPIFPTQFWKDDREAEGTRLLNGHRTKSSIEGSNPSSSVLLVCSHSSVGQSRRLITARSQVRALVGVPCPYSSVGQSARLISVRSQVQVLVGVLSYSGLAQQVEQAAVNRRVVGSSPTTGATHSSLLFSRHSRT